MLLNTHTSARTHTCTHGRTDARTQSPRDTTHDNHIGRAKSGSCGVASCHQRPSCCPLRPPELPHRAKAPLRRVARGIKNACIDVQPQGAGVVPLIDPESTPHRPEVGQSSSPRIVRRATVDDNFRPRATSPRVAPKLLRTPNRPAFAPVPTLIRHRPPEPTSRRLHSGPNRAHATSTPERSSRPGMGSGSATHRPPRRLRADRRCTPDRTDSDRSRFEIDLSARC